MRPKKLRRSDGAQIVNSNGGAEEKKRKADQAKGARREKQTTSKKQKGQKKNQEKRKPKQRRRYRSIATRESNENESYVRYRSEKLRLSLLVSHISFFDDRSRCIAELQKETPKPEGTPAAKEKMRPKKLRRSDGAQIVNSNGGAEEKRRKADQAKGARREKQTTRTKQKGQKTRTRKNENLNNDDGIDPLRPVSRKKTNRTCVIEARNCVSACS